jgi:hypothetical protein
MAWSVVTAYRDGSVGPVGFGEQLMAVAALVVGFVGSALLASLSRRQKAPGSQMSSGLLTNDFNPILVQEVLDRALPSRSALGATSQPWDLETRALLGRDKSLALAKLRLDIERQLRVLAFRSGDEAPSRPAGVTQLAESLVRKGALPVETLPPLQQILSVCNLALHGNDISDALADAVVSVGEDLLSRLAELSDRTAAPPTVPHSS